MKQNSFLVKMIVSALITWMVVIIDSSANTTWVGNGNDGTDLEGFALVQSGVLTESRDQAIRLLQRLNTPGVPGLGALLPELTHSPLYLSKSDVQSQLTSDLGVFHGNMAGKVYARTFPESHAATRFFPVALTLDQNQLVALHVHEALHRALPEEARQNESTVSQITLAITTPDSSYDRVVRVTHDLLDLDSDAELPKIRSSLTYTNRPNTTFSHLFNEPDYDSMHILEGKYWLTSRIQLGLAVSHFYRSRYDLGPTRFSIAYSLNKFQGFSIDLLGEVTVCPFVGEKFDNSQNSRKIITPGISIGRTFGRFSLQNTLSYTLPSDASYGYSTYNATSEGTQSYGGILSNTIRLDARFGKLKLGAVGYLDFASYSTTINPTTEYGSRARTYIGIGPAVSWNEDHFSVFITGKRMKNDMSYSSLGDPLNRGSGIGYVAFGFSAFF